MNLKTIIISICLINTYALLTNGQFFRVLEGSVLNRNGKRDFVIEALKRAQSTSSEHIEAEEPSSINTIKNSALINEIAKIVMRKIIIELNSNQDINFN